MDEAIFMCLNFKHNMGIYIFSIQINISLNECPATDRVDGKLTLENVMASLELNIVMNMF